jgi:hypothetical protein
MLYPLQVRISPVKWKGSLGDAPRGLFLRGFELLDECSKSRGMGAARMTDPRILPRLRLDISGVK